MWERDVSVSILCPQVKEGHPSPLPGFLYSEKVWLHNDTFLYQVNAYRTWGRSHLIIKQVEIFTWGT